MKSPGPKSLSARRLQLLRECSAQIANDDFTPDERADREQRELQLLEAYYDALRDEHGIPATPEGPEHIGDIISRLPMPQVKAEALT